MPKPPFRRRSKLRKVYKGGGKKSKPRIRKPLALMTHNFVERTNSTQIVVAQESAAVGLFKDFSLSQCLNALEYTTLFEYYKINKAVVEFRYKGPSTPAYTTINGTGTQNNEIVNEVNPVLYFKVDHNDINADSLTKMKESMRTHEHQFTNNKPNFTITLKPAVQVEAYKSAIASTYMPKWGQWLSTADNSVPHYGLKCYAVAGLGSSANMGAIEVQTKIYFSAKCNE